MQPQSQPCPVLFANTGVQYVSVPLSPGVRFSADQIGYGWQHCRCKPIDKVAEYGYLQWQLVPGQNRLFLAVDTTLGSDEDDTGYFCKAGALVGDFHEAVAGLLGANGELLQGLPPIELTIRSATAEGGEPKDVHMVVDFGNSRSGALLLEFRGDTMQEPLMNPLPMVNRYHLDSWDEKGDIVRSEAARWFSSKTHWCTSPYLDPPQIETIEYVEEKKKGFFGGESVERRPVTVLKTPATFQDCSMVRMGREADDLAMLMRTEGGIRTSVSSPKRYLWAKDDSWLEGANWWMADPFGRHNQQTHATTLKGPLLRFFPEDDQPDDPVPQFEPTLLKPRYAPRTLMCAALYEMLCQAYTYINSPTYGRKTGDPNRIRRLRSMTLTYPSGMIAVERERLQKQAYKAIRIFIQTLGKGQQVEPELKLSVDEASAVHLVYIWSEVQKLGRKPGLWFSLMGREEEAPPSQEAAEAVATAAPEAKETPGRLVRRPTAPARGKAPATARTKNGCGPELRIACIDIGGGTSDLMIAKYVCESEVGGNRILGETLHRDGISLAGDHLVKRLLELVVVPKFAQAVGMEPHVVQTLFGPEVPGVNREFRTHRINWINRLFVPLAQRYLENAVDEVTDEISHTDGDLIAPEVVDSLQNTINRLFGPGSYTVNNDLGLRYCRDEFEDVVHEVFDDLIFDFCESIVQYKADVVLLAGQPTKLGYIQQLVETYLPLPKSRIIPMYGRYAGVWYPYQSPDNLNPGVIIDPKSTVVVGAAIEFAARFGMLTQFKFKMADKAAEKSYYWGIMTESRIDETQILFKPLPDEKDRVRKFTMSDQRLVIGRKRRPYDNAQASPIYLLKVDMNGRIGEIDVKVELERKAGPDGEEMLEPIAVQGDVAGEPADLGKNIFFEWRTLADEQYYLDTGGLNKIDMDRIG